MKKYILGILSLFIIIILYFNFNINKLENMDVKSENLVGSYISPERDYILKIYFNGGIFFRTDVSYIGVLENLGTKKKKNIFLVSAALGNVGWLNNSTIFFQDKQLPINRIYDFRKANE
ncbi:DUF5412 family protein [Rummeliibacillus sp. POC4]|nr:DUF5412 family protein [Rummeliibacillus sp. POC4]RIJ63322.1 hypothetical protein D1606_15660 [Rummeliibacillus sp. POC4]